ncbi:MAG: hypothetical protein M1834_006967 [Cirrosporium novae-zelandiae]|nr:MAG: hypothetical protein M1834_006967 [Cirrosporium novae-zelandiae]
MLDVTVSNTGNETITVFKGHTVLSGAATGNLDIVTENGTDIPYSGLFIRYQKNNVSKDMFETFEPGESIATTINVAQTRKLDNVTRASLSVKQKFRYVLGDEAPSSIDTMTKCPTVTSQNITITPEQATVKRDHISSRVPATNHLSKRDGLTIDSCTDAQVTSLKTTVGKVKTQAQSAYTASLSTKYYWTTWFKSTSVQSKVESIYKKVVNVESIDPIISCTDKYDACSGAMLYATQDSNFICVCSGHGYWDLDEYAADCDSSDYDRVGSVLHEMTHLFGTSDHAYGRDDCLDLSATEAADNADTYELYMESNRLGGCK